MTFMPPMPGDSRRRRAGWDPVVRLIVVNWALGMGLGASFAVALLAFDFQGIRTLLWRSDVAVVGVILFVGMFALTFGGVVAAGAAMRAGRDDDDEPRGGLRAPALAYVAARSAR